MITPSFSLTATERVLPKMALDFTTASLDGRITFTRSLATATRVNNSGNIELVAANTPRFDYDPVTLVCKGLLIEEARTNGCAQSSNPASSEWATTSLITKTSTNNEDPSGSSNAALFTASGGSGAHFFQASATTLVSFTSGTTYTLSIFVKPGTQNYVQITGSSPIFGSSQYANFDLTGNGSVGTVVGGTAVITKASNGYFRIAFITIATATSPGVWGTVAYVSNASASRLAVNSLTTNAYFWGAQVEAGAFATSYIPTTTTALTRNADVATMTGTNFSDWFNASEGTFAVEGSAFAEVQGGQKQGFLLVSPTAVSSSYRVSIAPLGYTIVDGTTQVNQSLSSFVANTNYTVVAGYKLNDCQFASNSTLGATDTACTIPTVDFAQFGRFRSGDGLLSGYIKSMRYWPQRLTGAELQAFSN